MAAGRFEQACLRDLWCSQITKCSMLALAYIDLEPQSSDSLANSENLPYVAWRSISHEDRDGRLTADCFCQGTQNSSIMRKIKTCPPIYPRQTHHGYWELVSYTTKNHCCTNQREGKKHSTCGFKNKRTTVSVYIAYSCVIKLIRSSWIPGES